MVSIGLISGFGPDGATRLIHFKPWGIRDGNAMSFCKKNAGRIPGWTAGRGRE